MMSARSRTAATLLRPGARLVLFVPSLPFLYGTMDAQVDHQRRYTKTTLSEAVRSAGLKLERIEYFDFLGMVPWFLLGRVLRHTTSGGGIPGYDRFASRCAGLRPRLMARRWERPHRCSGPCAMTATTTDGLELAELAEHGRRSSSSRIPPPPTRCSRPPYLDTRSRSQRASRYPTGSPGARCGTARGRRGATWRRRRAGSRGRRCGRSGGTRRSARAGGSRPCRRRDPAG